MESGTVQAVLGASVGLAGLLLVFVGFVYGRADSFTDTRRRDSYQRIARIGIAPFVASLVCAWLCLEALTGSQQLTNLSLVTFRIALLAAGAYGVFALAIL